MLTQEAVPHWARAELYPGTDPAPRAEVCSTWNNRLRGRSQALQRCRDDLRPCTLNPVKNASMPLDAAHRRLLERFRHSMNLVGPGPIAPHFEDCRLALQGLAPSGRWADLGSGAGFPGLVLAAGFPLLRLELVDSRRKRCTFLEMVLAEAPGTQATVQHGRVEQLPDGAYDGLLARAFAPPDQVLTHARRLLRPGGLAVLLLSDQQDPEPLLPCVHQHQYTLAGRTRQVRWYRQPGAPTTERSVPPPRA